MTKIFACGLPHSTDLSPQNPNLGPLQDNGGPTFTQALGNINAKNVGAGCPATDQRGYLRLPAACDIGAYEDTTDNPVPAITTLFPNSKPAGESGFTLTVNGYTYGPFVEGLSVVYWNGKPQTNDLYERLPAYSRHNHGRPGCGRTSPGHGCQSGAGRRSVERGGLYHYPRQSVPDDYQPQPRYAPGRRAVLHPDGKRQ